ncbi:MAG: polyhydroxybutyrate depolymerase [Pseudomonadota bacterium]
MRLILMLIVLFVSPAFACGPDSRCEVEGGYYLASPPPDWDGESPLALIVYFHGWNGSPEGTFRNKSMWRAAHRRGALFIAPYAPYGYWRQIGEDRAERGRDEAAYTRAVLADIRKRWPIDETRTLASGFSRGGSMVWNVACYVGGFAGYAPIAGGFWRSTPADCPVGAVNMRHIHGLKDGVVAYDEIGVYNSMPVTEGLALYRRLNGSEAPETFEQGRFTCERWPGEKTLEVCLHAKGHSIPAEWVAEGLDWLDEISAP